MNNLEEQDQLNELRAWWEEYGKSVIFGVVLAVVTIGGWNFWQQYRTQQAEQASDIYYQMMDAYSELEKNIEQGGQEKNQRMVKQSEFQEAVNNLKSQYPKSEYAQFARLQNAKHHVLQNDLNSAENELKEVLSNRPSKEIALLTRTRLARVLLANGKYDEALKISDSKDSESYEAVFLEIQGDIYFAQGDKQKAFLAYEQAKEKTEQASEKLNMKYYNLLVQ